ncbi:RodZ domain-containing protein [Aquibaculum sediminis]|uniref:RodZ domain-containing protein n=1 Tax=Aquibaculum sediminis TaxID=3231907 RepID=UPI003455E70E
MTQDAEDLRYKPEWPEDGHAPQRRPEPIGSILRRSRYELGYELETVAAELRIRRPYLEAIEEGHYEELPGTPYAIGFVRSYAEYLGLDSDATVALFKSEINEAARAKQDLSFPAPKPEGRLPGFALVLISLLVVALAYGGWHVWSQSGKPFVELLPLPGGEEPVQLAEQEVAEPEDPPAATLDGTPEQDSLVGRTGTTEEATSPAPDSATALPDEDLSDPQTPQGTETGALEPGAEGADVEGSEESLLPDGTDAGDTEVPSLADAQPEPEATSDDALPEPPAVEGAGEDTAAPAVPGEAGADAEEAPLAASELEEPEEPLLSMDDLGTGQRYGAESADVRVVLLATADSWIQVRSASDELLFTRVLRPGDTYRVPDQEGLSLLTGNAGGLDIVVEGRRLAPLGPNGAVRRDISLDPEALRSRGE